MGDFNNSWNWKIYNRFFLYFFFEALLSFINDFIFIFEISVFTFINMDIPELASLLNYFLIYYFSRKVFLISQTIIDNFEHFSLLESIIKKEFANPTIPKIKMEIHYSPRSI